MTTNPVKGQALYIGYADVIPVLLDRLIDQVRENPDHLAALNEDPASPCNFLIDILPEGGARIEARYDIGMSDPAVSAVALRFLTVSVNIEYRQPAPMSHLTFSWGAPKTGEDIKKPHRVVVMRKVVDHLLYLIHGPEIAKSL